MNSPERREARGLVVALAAVEGFLHAAANVLKARTKAYNRAKLRSKKTKNKSAERIALKKLSLMRVLATNVADLASDVGTLATVLAWNESSWTTHSKPSAKSGMTGILQHYSPTYMGKKFGKFTVTDLHNPRQSGFIFGYEALQRLLLYWTRRYAKVKKPARTFKGELGKRAYYKAFAYVLGCHNPGAGAIMYVMKGEKWTVRGPYDDNGKRTRVPVSNKKLNSLISFNTRSGKGAVDVLKRIKQKGDVNPTTARSIETCQQAYFSFVTWLKAIEQ